MKLRTCIDIKKRIKRKATEWEVTFLTHVTEKGFLSRIENFYKLIIKIKLSKIMEEKL